MEIDRAVNDSSDRRLQIKYDSAVYVIQRAFALYSFNEIAFSFNGGKDSTVLLHLLRAGYYLHLKSDSFNGSQMDHKEKCPIRTIYFESNCAFPEINSFTYETASQYGLPLEIIRTDFKSGLEDLLKKNPTKAIFIGTRIGDPNAVSQEQFCPSSPGWPPFMRVNPILDWSYRDVWCFLLTCKVSYCSLYDKGYTSIGSTYDTVPNALLCIPGSSNMPTFQPAYKLSDGRLERAGRTKKSIKKCESASNDFNGTDNLDMHQHTCYSASIIVIGDEFLFGTVQDNLGAALCHKLHKIGWLVSHVGVVRNEIDSVADEVEKQKSAVDMVFLFGGLGPLHSDVSLAGVAKAFGVRLAPDEEFEENLRKLIGSNYTGDQNEMALLPEGITDLLYHKMLPLPLIKCRNVIILATTNLEELETEWHCLTEMLDTSVIKLAPFVSKHLSTNLSDVTIAPVLSKVGMDFPAVYIGCRRKSRKGPLVISFVGKDNVSVEAAVETLTHKFHGAFSETDEFR